MTAKEIPAVDDEEDRRDMTGSLLDRMGYQAVLVQGPDNALNFMEKDRFCLVITYK